MFCFFFFGKHVQKPPAVTPQLLCNVRTTPLLSRATKDRQQTSHSSVLSSSQSLLSFRHPPLNFNTCPCILPPRQLRTCCSSHSRMLFGVAVTAGTVLHPHTPEPRPPLFCGGLLQTHTTERLCRHSKNGMGYFKTSTSLFSFTHSESSLE